MDVHGAENGGVSEGPPTPFIVSDGDLSPKQGLDNPAFTDTNNPQDDEKKFRDRDLFEDVEDDEPPTGCAAKVQEIQNAIYGFFGRNKKIIQYSICALLVIGYFVYFGFAMAYEFGEEQSIRLLFCTCIVVFFVFVAIIKHYWGSQIVAPITSSSVASSTKSNWGVIRWFVYIGVLLGIIIYIVVEVALDEPRNLVSISGTATYLILLYLTSINPAKVKWEPVVVGLYMQVIMGILVLRTTFGFDTFEWMGDRVTEFLTYADAGSIFVFGENYTDHFFAFAALPIVIFFSSFISIMYYLGVMQLVIGKIAWVMQRMMGTTAGESLNAAGNIFIGQTEAPLLVKPLLSDMTNSELHAVMTGGFATIAGSVMATYILFGVPANHLLSASIMSAPAALAVSKLSYPELGKPKTTGEAVKSMQKGDERNVIEAASNGASNAISLVANIAANLIAFLALLEFVNTTLAWFGHRVGLGDEPGEQQLSFQLICSYVLWPLAYVMGVPSEDCRKVAELIGVKTFINEFVAFDELAGLIANTDTFNEYVDTGGPWIEDGDDIFLVNTNTTLVDGVLEDRSIIISTYALCGFANIGSIGIQLGGLGAMAPHRRGDLADMAMRAMICGNVACFLTACVAGLLYDGR